MGETFLPWTLFLLYVLAIIGLTWWNRRKAATMSAFAVGTRSLPPFLVGLSLAANMTSV
ncbi:MAG: sodium:solute symporter, partial [Holophagae bacterium]